MELLLPAKWRLVPRRPCRKIRNILVVQMCICFGLLPQIWMRCGRSVLGFGKVLHSVTIGFSSTDDYRDSFNEPFSALWGAFQSALFYSAPVPHAVLQRYSVKSSCTAIPLYVWWQQPKIIIISFPGLLFPEGNKRENLLQWSTRF